MAKRTCASCGKDKELEGGKVCERGHFVCKGCVYAGSNMLFLHKKTKCPLCGTVLR